MNEAPVTTAEQTTEIAQTPIETPKPINDAARNFAILARKEKATVMKQRELQQKEIEYQSKLAAIEAKEKEYLAKEALWKENPLEALKTYGHTYQTVTERMLAGDEPTPNMILQRLEQLQNQNKELEAKMLEREQQKATQEEQMVIDGFKEDLKEFVASNESKYKLVSLFDPDAELIYDTIDEFYNMNGKILTHEEAASAVNSYFKKLVDQANGALTPPKPQQAQKTEENTFRQQSKTLTNQLQSSVPSVLPAKQESDRLKRALAALEGK